jgi:lipoprotein-releasing system ATP-binding protein
MSNSTVMKAGLSVEARALSKNFQKAGETIQVLNNLEISVAAGETVSILGASGAGKSTLLYVLGTLEAAQSGELWIGGERLTSQGGAMLAEFRNRRLGFVFQFHHLLKDFSAEENVAMPLWVRGEKRLAAMMEARLALERVGLAHRLKHRPGELSGGEQQRVAIARALVGQPQLLLADEPTGNLDRSTGEQIQDLLMTLNRETGCTLIVVTHNETFARKTQRTVWLHDGKIIHAPPSR